MYDSRSMWSVRSYTAEDEVIKIDFGIRMAGNDFRDGRASYENFSSLDVDISRMRLRRLCNQF